MRFARALSPLLCLSALCMWGQQSETNPDQPTLTVRSTLVRVPVLVKNKAGRVVFELTADDFRITDNGVQQKATLDADTDSQPLALAIVVENGGLGVEHLGDYSELGSVLEALIGNVEHRVAVINFDSAPYLLVPFSSRTADVTRALSALNEGDSGAAILDGIAFAVEQLRGQPPRYRRAILLLSETVDQGSKTNLDEAQRIYKADVNLYNNKAIPRNQLDVDKAKLDQAQVQYSQALRQLQLGAVAGYGQSSVQYAQAAALGAQSGERRRDAHAEIIQDRDVKFVRALRQGKLHVQVLVGWILGHAVGDQMAVHLDLNDFSPQCQRGRKF